MDKILTVKRICRIEARLLKKVVGIANKRISSDDLDQIYHDCDLGSHTVDTLEQVPVVGRRFELLFQEICLFNSKKHLVDIWGILR